MSRAFTLVELLVVVAIIVVLLALLVPAMDKAIYQAELVVCATQIRHLGTAATTYAMDNKRHYPLRPNLSPDGGVDERGVQSYKLCDPVNGKSNGVAAPYDIRPSLRPLINLNQVLNDPLAPGELDFELRPDITDTHLYGSYSMWFGWRYGSTSGGAGMIRLGDRWVWNKQRYNLIAADYSMPRSQTPGAYSSHPDNALLAPSFINYEVFPLGGFWAGSYWHRPGSPVHEPLDMNYGYDDGSVLRLASLKFENDTRVDEVPNFNAGVGEQLQVPNP